MITYRMRGLVNLHAVAATALIGLWFLAYASVFGYLPGRSFGPEIPLALYFLCVSGGMLGSMRFLTRLGSRYHRLTWIDAVRLATRQVVLTAMVLFTVMVATKDRSVSRLFVTSFLIQAWLVLILLNAILPRYLARLVFYKTHHLPTVFIGRVRSMHRLREWVAQKEGIGIQPVGFLSDEPVDRAANAVATFLGPVEALPRVLHEKKVGQVIVLDVPGSTEVTRHIVETCQGEGCRLLIYDNMADRLPVPMSPVVEEGHLFYTARDEPLEDPLNRMAKRILDILIALPVVTLFLPPLCLWVWVMQRRQAPGPLFFVRNRGGQNRSEFRMLKFRSMYDSHADPHREARQASRSDDRVYPFGRFLRKTSLDEFPQFLNVLLGEMSIVGPRPHLPTHDKEFAKIERSYRTRALVKPGITGLAQTSGFRGEVSDHETLRRRVELDIRYITSWSIWLDMGIILRTAWQVVFPPKTAY